MPLKLMYITNNLDVALVAEKYGVDRIWVDLEVLGKETRQKGADTVKSKHSIEDIKRIKPYLSSAEMLVRINQWNDDSVNEIEQVIEAGADIIMLPYWKSVDQVNRFINTVKHRCKTILLLETKEAVECIDDVLLLGGFDEIHIGLNDLHISYNLTFMFELLVNGVVESVCKKIRKYNIPYGFGGIARIGEGYVAAEKIILEHYRLGSTMAILSRSFCDWNKILDIKVFDKLFGEYMSKLREFESYAKKASPEELKNNRDELIKDIDNVVNIINLKKVGQ